MVLCSIISCCWGWCINYCIMLLYYVMAWCIISWCILYNVYCSVLYAFCLGVWSEVLHEGVVLCHGVMVWSRNFVINAITQHGSHRSWDCPTAGCEPLEPLVHITDRGGRVALWHRLDLDQITELSDTTRTLHILVEQYKEQHDTTRTLHITVWYYQNITHTGDTVHRTAWYYQNITHTCLVLAEHYTYTEKNDTCRIPHAHMTARYMQNITHNCLILPEHYT